MKNMENLKDGKLLQMKNEYILWWTRCTIPAQQRYNIVIQEAMYNSNPFFINLFNEITELKDGFICLKKCYE